MTLHRIARTKASKAMRERYKRKYHLIVLRRTTKKSCQPIPPKLRSISHHTSTVIAMIQKALAGREWKKGEKIMGEYESYSQHSHPQSLPLKQSQDSVFLAQHSQPQEQPSPSQHLQEHFAFFIGEYWKRK